MSRRGRAPPKGVLLTFFQSNDITLARAPERAVAVEPVVVPGPEPVVEQEQPVEQAQEPVVEQAQEQAIEPDPKPAAEPAPKPAVEPAPKPAAVLQPERGEGPGSRLKKAVKKVQSATQLLSKEKVTQKVTTWYTWAAWVWTYLYDFFMTLHQVVTKHPAYDGTSVGISMLILGIGLFSVPTQNRVLGFTRLGMQMSIAALNNPIEGLSPETAANLRSGLLVGTVFLTFVMERWMNKIHEGMMKKKRAAEQAAALAFLIFCMDTTGGFNPAATHTVVFKGAKTYFYEPMIGDVCPALPKGYRGKEYEDTNLKVVLGCDQPTFLGSIVAKANELKRAPDTWDMKAGLRTFTFCPRAILEKDTSGSEPVWREKERNWYESKYDSVLHFLQRWSL